MKCFELIKRLGKLGLQRKIVHYEDIGKAYTKVSDYYENYFLKIMHVHNDKVLEKLVENSDEDVESILDLACGTGYNSEQLARKYKNAYFHLVDISRGMLSKAREKQIAHAIYYEQDMLSFLHTQPDGRFDMVVCCWAIKYQNPHKIIKEVHRILKPGGTFGVIVNTKETLPEIRKVYPKLLIKQPKAIKEIMLALPNPKNKHIFGKWFRSVGFEEIKVVQGRQIFQFNDMRKLVRWVTHTGALAGFDCMIDLKDESIQHQLAIELKKEKIKQITHSFVWGVFRK